MIVRVGEPGQREDLAIGESPIGKSLRDFVDTGEGVADTKPFPHRAQFGVDSVRDPVRATGSVVECPLAADVELDQQRMNADMSSDSRRAASTTADRSDISTTIHKATVQQP